MFVIILCLQRARSGNSIDINKGEPKWGGASNNVNVILFYFSSLKSDLEFKQVNGLLFLLCLKSFFSKKPENELAYTGVSV